jgi:hypothetical protein
MVCIDMNSIGDGKLGIFVSLQHESLVQHLLCMASNTMMRPIVHEVVAICKNGTRIRHCLEAYADIQVWVSSHYHPSNVAECYPL